MGEEKMMTIAYKKTTTKMRIEENRKLISKMLSGADTHKRINNLNWLRHELSYEEPRILFYMPRKDQGAYLDHTSMTNIGLAYDYILDNFDSPIDVSAIRKLHSMLCAGTNITGGMFRTTNKFLEITVDGAHMHAPDYHEIEYHLNEIIYRLNNDKTDTLTRAFRLHYDLIALQLFDDYNKRTSRMLMNWELLRGGYRPITFNKPSDKIKYREAISAMANGHVKEYTTYMSQCLLRTQEGIIKTLKASKIY